MNHVEMRGTFSVWKSWPGSQEKQALVIGNIKPSGDKGSFRVKAFGDAAVALGNADGLTVTIVGKIGKDKPKDSTVKDWPMIVVAEKVTEHPPRGHAEADEPF